MGIFHRIAYGRLAIAPATTAALGHCRNARGPMPKAVLPMCTETTQERSLEDLNDAVKPVVNRLPLSVCRAAAQATIRRAKQCIERNWGHIEHVFGADQYGDRRRSKSTQTKYL